jgi:RNA polymerase sigma-70 factor (ECF subfamily)
MAMELTTSVELMRQARDGSARALERLFARYVPSLRRWAAGRLPRWARDLTDTDDMIQETMLKTFRRIDHFEQREESGGLHAYMRQALQNRIKDELRRAHRHPQREEINPDERDAAPSPLEETIGVEATQRYEAALHKLKPMEREAVIARVELGLDYRTIADSLGKNSADAARMTVIRALDKLAQEMGR